MFKSGLDLAKYPEPYRTRVGQDVVFSANLSTGTDVTFSWWLLGDGQIYVQTGVELVANFPMSQRGIVIQNEATVTFTANTHPDVRCLVDGYEWKLLRDQRDYAEIIRTVTSDLIYTYRKLGTFSVTVMVSNELNKQTSQPLNVSVFGEIQAIKILVRGETIINNQIEFDAYHCSGTSVTCMWYFGDYTTANATISGVKHSYTMVGQFVIQVVARNAISQQTANQTIFIVLKLCKPPVVNLRGPSDIIASTATEARLYRLLAIRGH